MCIRSESTAELSAALAKAQATMKSATFNRINPHFKNRYADLASVLDAVRKPLADNGLAITQTTEMQDGAFVLVTTLWHGGQWISAVYPLPLGAKPQELGSALTYARRYSLSSLVCIAADEDDDAEAASKETKTLPKKDAKGIYEKMQVEVRSATSRDHLRDWAEGNKDRIAVLPDDWQDILRLQYEEMMADLRQRETASIMTAG
jgi:hypothetical protein